MSPVVTKTSSRPPVGAYTDGVESMPASVHFGQPGVVEPFKRWTAYTQPLPLDPTTTEVPSESSLAWVRRRLDDLGIGPQEALPLEAHGHGMWGHHRPGPPRAVKTLAGRREAGWARADWVPMQATTTIVTVTAATVAAHERRRERGRSRRVDCLGENLRWAWMTASLSVSSATGDALSPQALFVAL